MKTKTNEEELNNNVDKLLLIHENYSNDHNLLLISSNCEMTSTTDFLEAATPTKMLLPHEMLMPTDSSSTMGVHHSGQHSLHSFNSDLHNHHQFFQSHHNHHHHQQQSSSYGNNNTNGLYYNNCQTSNGGFTNNTMHYSGSSNSFSNHQLPHLIVPNGHQFNNTIHQHNSSIQIKQEDKNTAKDIKLESVNSTIELTTHTIKEENLETNLITKNENKEEINDQVTTNASVANEIQESQPEIDIFIRNVVCAFNVSCHLSLRDIALKGTNVEFKRENGMVTMKLRKPYTTASIWSSGKITCTGATSEDDAHLAARRYARVLQKLQFRVRFRNYRVVNVLCTCKMPFAIKIVQFSEKFKKQASYEPELHPGVTFNLEKPKSTLKIFSTGSMTVTARSVANVQAAISYIYDLVHEFRKPRPPPAAEEPVVIEEEDDDDYLDLIEVDNGGETIISEMVEVEPVEEEDDAESIDDDFGNGPMKKRRYNKPPTDTQMIKRKLVNPNAKHKRVKRPLGKSINDPFEDIITVSDIDEADVNEVSDFE